MGKKTFLPVHAEFYDPETEVYSIELSDYLIYVKKGDSFDPMTYFVSSDAGMSPEIESNVDMETARNGGLVSCGVTWGFRGRKELQEAGAVHLTETAGELLSLVLGQ